MMWKNRRWKANVLRLLSAAMAINKLRLPLKCKES